MELELELGIGQLAGSPRIGSALTQHRLPSFFRLFLIAIHHIHHHQLALRSPPLRCAALIMNAREAKTVIINHGSHTITAGYGIHDILRPPSISLTARVGLPRALALPPASTPPPDYSQYLVGAALDDAERSGDDIAIYWPMRSGRIRDWQQMIALWRYLLFQLLPVQRSHNDSHILLSLPAPISRHHYSLLTKVFFEHLNAPALCIVEKPILAAYGVGSLNACVVDIGYEACNITPVIDCLVQHNATLQSPVGIHHCTRFLANLLKRDQSIVRALTTFLRYIHKNKPQSDLDLETQLHRSLVALAHQLLVEGHVLDDDALSSGAARLGAARDVATDDDEGNFDIAAALVHGDPKSAAAAAAEHDERQRAALEAALPGDDLDESIIASITGPDGQSGASTDPKAVLVHHRGLNLKVGPERFRFIEPLFHPDLLKDVPGLLDLGDEPFGAGPDSDSDSAPGTFDTFTRPDAQDWTLVPSLPASIARSISQIQELDRRPLMWENLVITGTPARIKTIQMETISALGDYISSNSTEATQLLGEPNPLQPRNVRALRVPDYFSEFKDRTDLAPFVGGTIYAKVRFMRHHKLCCSLAHSSRFVPFHAACVWRPLRKGLCHETKLQRSRAQRLIHCQARCVILPFSLSSPRVLLETGFQLKQTLKPTW